MSKLLPAAVAVVVTAVAGGALARDYTAGSLQIRQTWSLPVPSGAPTAAGYLTVANTGKTEDRLVGAVSPDVDHVEVHEMKMAGAIMRMRAIPHGLVIPPGRTVTLAPGGYHLMLIGPKHGFKVGEHIPATLRFEHAGLVKVDFLVQTASGAGSMSMR